MSQKTPENPNFDLTANPEQPLRRKIVTYQGFWGLQGEVAYVRRGEKIYFSGITVNTTTTINAEEEVIAAICQVEGVQWSDVGFIDINTAKGYISYQPGDYNIVELHLIPNKKCPSGYQIEFESVISCRSGLLSVHENPEKKVPQDVFNHFQDLIVGIDESKTIEGTYKVV